MKNMHVVNVAPAIDSCIYATIVLRTYIESLYNNNNAKKTSPILVDLVAALLVEFEIDICMQNCVLGEYIQCFLGKRQLIAYFNCCDNS